MFCDSGYELVDGYICVPATAATAVALSLSSIIVSVSRDVTLSHLQGLGHLPHAFALLFDRSCLGVVWREFRVVILCSSVRCFRLGSLLRPIRQWYFLLVSFRRLRHSLLPVHRLSFHLYASAIFFGVGFCRPFPFPSIPIGFGFGVFFHHHHADG